MCTEPSSVLSFDTKIRSPILRVGSIDPEGIEKV
jgi:hypothetical protein